MKIIIKATRKLFLKIFVLATFLAVFISVVMYARGYRLNLAQGTIASTGILSISSNPKPASIYINGELGGATDSNISLPYGIYNIEVRKEGYSSWSKQVALKGEIVMSLNAKLFLKNPALTPLTNIGVTRAIPVGNSDRLIVVTKTGNIEKDGVYLFAPSYQPVAIFPPLKMLLLGNLLPEEYDITSLDLVFNPTYEQAVATFYEKEDDDLTVTKKSPPQTIRRSVSYLLNLDTQNMNLFDLQSTKEAVISKWNIEKYNENNKLVETLPKKLQPLASTNMLILSMSPDDKKILYVAKSNVGIPPILSSPLIGTNQTKEIRDIVEGKVYVYDIREDKNYELSLSNIPELSQSLKAKPPSEDLLNFEIEFSKYLSNYYDYVSQLRNIITWLPTSDYLVLKEDKQLAVLSYDGSHKEIVYAGPFEREYFGVNADSDLMTIINLNPQNNDSGDLYAINLW
jgi:hypothetical protein